MDEQRIDKWLWCARVFKTRGVASDAIKSGRVSINGLNAKPARAVRIGDKVVVRKPPYDYTLNVVGFSNQRVPASRVPTLYEEPEDSVVRRNELAQLIKASAVTEDARFGKLTKKERRDRERLKRSI